MSQHLEVTLKYDLNPGVAFNTVLELNRPAEKLIGEKIRESLNPQVFMSERGPTIMDQKFTVYYFNLDITELTTLFSIIKNLYKMRKDGEARNNV